METPDIQMTVITISESPTGWVATYSGAEGREIARLFGTDAIPTAFTLAMPRAEVLANVRALNPHAIVQ